MPYSHNGLLRNIPYYGLLDVINMDGRVITPVVSGGLTATDFNATCTGCFRVNGVLQLDGVNDFIQLPGAAMEANGLSGDAGYMQIDFKAKESSPAQNNDILVLGEDNSNVIRISQGAGSLLCVHQYRAGGVSEYLASDAFSVSEFVRQATRWTGGTVYSGASGSQTATTPIGGVWGGTFNTRCAIGALDGTFLFSHGMVDNVVISLGVSPADFALTGSTPLSAASLDAALGAGKWLWYA